MRREVVAVAVASALLVGSCAPDEVATDIATQVEPAVVRLLGDVCGVPLLASGVVIQDGVVVTVAHVIAGSRGDIAVRFPSGSEAAATVVGFDPKRDLALLSVDGVTAPVSLGTAEAGSAGRIVTMSRDDDIVVTPYEVRRFINATGEDIYGERTGVARSAIELETDVMPGMSGGGAFDDDGKLVGVVFAESRGQPIAYAVAAGEVEQFMAETDLASTVEAGHC